MRKRRGFRNPKPLKTPGNPNMKRLSQLAVILACVLTSLLASSPLSAQGVSDIQTSATLATSALATVFTITGTAGTKCVLYAVPGASISTAGNCQTSDGKTTVTTPRIAATSNAVNVFLWGYAEVLCIGAANGTTTAVAAGAWTGLPNGAPANGLGMSCISGPGGAVTNYAISWPGAL
jgi:hypothetical protein